METMPLLTALPSMRKLFFYSASDYALIDELVSALMEIGPQASVFLRGQPGAKVGCAQEPRRFFLRRGAEARRDLAANVLRVFARRERACVGGVGGGASADPQSAPRRSRPTAKLLEEMGAGISLVPLERKRLREAIERVHTDPKFAASAQRAGEAAQAFLAQTNVLERTLGALRALV